MIFQRGRFLACIAPIHRSRSTEEFPRDSLNLDLLRLDSLRFGLFLVWNDVVRVI